MKRNTQSLILTAAVALLTGLCFYALISIANLNQIAVFLRTSFAIWIFLWLAIAFLYDMHFKASSPWQAGAARHAHIEQRLVRVFKTVWSAAESRLRHFLHWKEYSRALNYLLLPGFIFWGTVSLLYVELGDTRIQALISIFSTLALAANFHFIKEVFARNTERVEEDIFVAMSVVKIYAVALSFGAAQALMRRYCLEPDLFFWAIFSLCFLLVYQALFQHRLLGLKNLVLALILAALCGAIGYEIYLYWNFNFYTAAILFAAAYNLLWGVFHYYLDRALSWRAFAEIVAFCLIISAMVLSSTNFKARISDDCPFIRTSFP